MTEEADGTVEVQASVRVFRTDGTVEEIPVTIEDQEET